MKRKVLFIVYYLPPMGGSGVQRPLKFIKYLSNYGWHPVVLAPSTGAYHTFDESLMDELDRAETSIVRIEAETPFHTWSRLFSWVGKWPQSMQQALRRISNGLILPDNKKGWIEPALQQARELVERHDFEMIFSTAPPYSNHMIAARLKEETRLPVIMDFRDDWSESHLIDYPTRWHKRKMAKLEEQTVLKADALTVLDTFMAQNLKKRYGDRTPPCEVIPHGYDPRDFDGESESALEYQPNKLNLLYSGIFIHNNQPDSLLKAVKNAVEKSGTLKKQLALHFQGGLEKRHRKLIARLDLSDIVFDYGYLPHDQAVANLQKADALWFISNFGKDQQQVKSGKLYEYFGSCKPILGLIFKGGEEERLLKEYKASYITSPEDIKSTTSALWSIYDDWKNEKLPQPDRDWIKQYDRIQLTGQLAGLFNAQKPERKK